MKLLKWIEKLGVLSLLVMLIACGGGISPTDSFDPDAQLEEDISIIEAYLADNGYADYDTLDSEIRIVILEEGTGESIDLNDIIQYNYIGRWTTDVLFDTSIENLAFDQDLENTVDTTFVLDDNGDFKLDDGEKIVESINYEEDYSPIYSSIRTYEPFITTHTQNGWFILQSASILGFKLGAHEILDATNLGGRGLILIPSSLAYGNTGTTVIEPNTVILFEILPIRKR